MNVNIVLRSGKTLFVADFTHINYPNSPGTSITVKEFNDFYLYDAPLTFVGKTQVVSLLSTDIESIQIQEIAD